MTDRRFYTAITHVAKGVSQNPRSRSLERLKLRLDHDNLELTGYDLEFGIQRSIEVESDCSGEFVILPRLLSEAVRRFSGDVVTMEVDDNYVVKLFCDATEFQISAMSSEEYPALPSLDLAAGMQIEQPVLNSMIRQTSYATSVSEAKPVLTGELFEVEGDTLHVAAIDGYRLAVRRNPFPVRKTTALWYRNGPCWRWQICSTTMPKNSAPFPQTAGTWYSNSTATPYFPGFWRANSTTTGAASRPLLRRRSCWTPAN